MKNTINKVFIENPLTKKLSKGRSVKDAAQLFFNLGLVLWVFTAFLTALGAYFNVWSPESLTGYASKIFNLMFSMFATIFFLTSFILHGVAAAVDHDNKARNTARGLTTLGFIGISSMTFIAAIFSFYNAAPTVALMNIIGYSIAIGAWTLAAVTHFTASIVNHHNEK